MFKGRNYQPPSIKLWILLNLPKNNMVYTCYEGPISAMLRDNLYTWLTACSGINRTVQTQKMAIGLKIRIKQEHCGESKTQRKWFLDEKRDGLVDENRV